MTDHTSGRPTEQEGCSKYVEGCQKRELGDCLADLRTALITYAVASRRSPRTSR